MGRLIMVRKLAVALSVPMLVCYASLVSAMGLGEIQVNSRLNEAFRAEVPLRDLNGVSTDEILVRLASASDFDRAKLDRPIFLTEFAFQVASTGPGRAAIRVTGKSPVTEPIVEFLVDVVWPTGRMQRSYTVLLDPPRAPVLEPTLPVTSNTSSAPVARPNGSPRVSEPSPRAEPRVPGGSVGPIGRNDTAWGLALRVRPDSSVSVEQTMLALQRANPDAFIDGNINLLRAGVVLRAPTADEIANLSRSAARDEVQRQHEQWRSATRRDAAPVQASDQRAPSAGADATDSEVVLVGPGSDAAGASGTASGRADRGAAGTNAALTEELAATKEELDRVRMELDDARKEAVSAQPVQSPSTPSADPQQVQDLTQGIALRDQQLADLRAQVEALRREASTQPAVAANTPAAMGWSEMLTSPTGLSLLAVSVLLGIAALYLFMVNARTRGQLAAAGSAARPVARAPSPPSASAEQPRRVSDTVRTAAAQTGAGVAVAAVAAPRTRVEEPSIEVEEVADHDAFASTAVLSDAESVVRKPKIAARAAEPAEGTDVVSEADIYIAYGRFPQAVSFLQSALDREPDRNDARLKLMEVYVETKDLDAFNQEAQELLARAPSDAEMRRARQLQARLPGAQAVAPEEIGDDVQADFDKTIIDSDLAGKLAKEVRRPVEPEVALDLDLENPEGLIEIEADKPLDVDLSADADAALASDAQKDFDLTLDGFDDDADKAQLGGDLGLEFREARESGANDFDLDETAESAPPRAAQSRSPEDTVGLDLTLDGSRSVEPTRRAPPPTPSPDDDEGLSLTLDGLDDTLQPAELRSSSQNRTDTSLANSDTVETSALDDDLDFLGETDEASTKLDLARAYIDMGDEDGARDILQEVITEGNDNQQREAQELLDKLA